MNKTQLSLRLTLQVASLGTRLNDATYRIVSNLLKQMKQSGVPETEIVRQLDVILDLVEHGNMAAADLSDVYTETMFALHGETVARQAAPLPSRSDLAERWGALVRSYLAEAAVDVVAGAIRETISADMKRSSNAGVAVEGATGYRRVIHPEKSEGGTCGLCMVAATRLYYRHDLKPIHDGCNCKVVAVTEDNDPGADMNKIDFDAIYAASGDTTDGWTLKQTRFRFDADRGEIETVKDRAKKGTREPRED